MSYKDKEKQREKNREYQKKHYQNNKEYYITKSRESKSKAREEFKEFKKNLFCEICGENHPATLDFHHKNPNEKEIIVSRAAGRGWGKQKIQNEIDKCIVLCSNCHRKLHYQHQTE